MMGWTDLFRRGKTSRAARRPSRYQMGPEARKRMLEAAQYSSLFSQWEQAPSAINRTIFADLPGSRARSRDRAINDPYAKHFLRLLKHNVVGPQGPKLKSGVLDPDGTADRAAQRVIEDAWKQFCRHEADITGRSSFRELLTIVVGTVATDGEAIVRIRRGRQAGPAGIALQLLDAELLDRDLNASLSNGNTILMGVEMNPLGRPVRYHLIRNRNTDPAFPGSDKEHDVVPAGDLLHVYLQEFPGQVRGIPWFAPVLIRQRMLHDYMQSAAKAARIGADQGLLIRSPGGADSILGAVPDGDGGLDLELDPEVIAGQLGADEEVVSWNPAYPHQQFDGFVKTMLRTISAGVGVPYHALANDLEGVNYSSIRAGELETREAWMALQNWLFERFCSPVFEAWLEVALLLEQLKIGKGHLRVANYDKHRRHSWQGKRWAWVDPQKDISALIAAKDINATSVSQIIETQGGDPVETWERIAAEREEMAEYGIGPAAVTAQPPMLDEGEDEEDDEE